jgi:hypothetical protein
MEIQKTVEKLGEQMFLGFPAKDFERGGREQFIYLLRAGLTPDSRVVDVGCGILRAGYWLIHFLNPGCYHGIEPHTGRLDLGVNLILERETLATKRPRFDTNPNFDTSVFGEKFDFFLAYSIWTHASKGQIQTMLDSFVRDAADNGAFLTTYLPAGWTKPDYKGAAWHGTSHESEVPGCIYHNREWIKTACRRRGLVMKELGRDKTYGQSWLEIKRPARAADVRPARSIVA